MSSIDPALIVDYRLFGAPLPRADALPRTPSQHARWPRLHIHVNLLDDHWSVSGGHWSAELAARYERSAWNPQNAPAPGQAPSTQTSA